MTEETCSRYVEVNQQRVYRCDQPVVGWVTGTKAERWWPVCEKHLKDVQSNYPYLATRRIDEPGGG